MPEPKRDEDRRDREEPPGVATGKVLFAVLAVFVLLAASAGGAAALYRGSITGGVDPKPRALPEPQLEQNINPRRTADRGHGPGPYRERPVDRRAEERAPPSPALLAAMKAEAARGAKGYDPVGAAR